MPDDVGVAHVGAGRPDHAVFDGLGEPALLPARQEPRALPILGHDLGDEGHVRAQRERDVLDEALEERLADRPGRSLGDEGEEILGQARPTLPAPTSGRRHGVRRTRAKSTTAPDVGSPLRQVQVAGTVGSVPHGHVTLAAAFAASGVLSGSLIAEHAGAGDVLAWLPRTVVVAAAALLLVG